MKVHPPFHEFTFEATRSSGAGGQHVNKTDSAVILRWNPHQSATFSQTEIQRILQFLSHQLNREGELMIRSSESRSQKQNKERCVEKWIGLIEKALKPRIKRIATKPTRSSKVRRVNEKKRHAEVKKMRGRITDVE
jgi:ribosome-associated protein